MHGKRGGRHQSIQPSSAYEDKAFKMKFNLGNQPQKQIDLFKNSRASPNKVFRFDPHSSSSHSISSEDNDDYYEDFLQNVIYEKKKSRSHKASDFEVKALKEKIKKQSKPKKEANDDKKKRKKRTSPIKLHLAEVQEEKNSNINTISIVHPQRNNNQLLSIKNEESFSLNEIKKENKLDKVADDIKLIKELNSKSKAKEDNANNSRIKSPILTKDKQPLTLYKDLGAFSNIQENKSKKQRRQSVFDNHIGLRENSNNFDEYILQNINKKPRLSISPVRIRKDKMMKLINKKENSNEVWKSTNWGQIPNAGFMKKKSETECVNVKDKSAVEPKKDDASLNKKKVNRIEKQLTPQIETPSKASSITKSKKRFFLCCIPLNSKG